MPPEKLRIIVGDEVRDAISSADLDRLSDLWVEADFKPFDLPVSRIRSIVECVLNGLPLGSRLFNVIASAHDELRDRFPHLSRQRKLQAEQKHQFAAGFRQHLQEAFERGDLTIAKKGDQIVGMVRVVKLDNPGESEFIDGDVYEIGKALTVPGERKQGIYTQVREAAIAHAQRKYGNAPIITGTDKDPIKRLNRQDGWQEIGFEEYLRIHGADADYIRSLRQEIIEGGWTAFISTSKNQT